MPESFDVAVIGAGLAGAAAAWSLARRGRSVVLLEQFAAGHASGSSHGSARIVRRAYTDPMYVALTGAAFELWRELELASGTSVLRMLGGLDFGARRSVAESLAAGGVEHHVLSTDEAERRWPGMVFEGPVVFHPQAGTLDAELAVSTFVELAGALGADVRYSAPAVSVSAAGRVELASGVAVEADTVVVAAGSWVETLLSSVVPLPPLRVTQQSVFHFPRVDPSLPPWPSVIHDSPDAAVYHLAGGRDGGVADDRKIGQHDGGVPCTPASRPAEVSSAARTAAVEYVSRWLPGLVPTPRFESTCLYTETPSEDFILDRVGPVVVCSPCSGHGAKFAPVIGEMVAELICGSGRPVPGRFRLSSHREGLAGSVSL